MRPGSLYNAFPGGKRSLFMEALDRYSKLVAPEKLFALARAGRGAGSAPSSPYAKPIPLGGWTLKNGQMLAGIWRLEALDPSANRIGRRAVSSE